MATVDQLITISQNQGFIARVQYALQTAALNVYNEVPTTQGHAIRSAYATKVLNSPSISYSVVLGVLTNPTIVSEANPTITPDFGIADSDIQFQINSMWNALAGA